MHRSTTPHTYPIKSNTLLCISLNVLLKKIDTDRQLHVPNLRTIRRYPLAAISLNLLVKLIGIEPIVPVSLNLLVK